VPGRKAAEKGNGRQSPGLAIVVDVAARGGRKMIVEGANQKRLFWWFLNRGRTHNAHHQATETPYKINLAPELKKHLPK